MGTTVACPVCGTVVAGRLALAEHFVAEADASDGRHVMWLNRNVTRRHVPAAELAPLLDAALRGEAPPGDRVRR